MRKSAALVVVSLVAISCGGRPEAVSSKPSPSAPPAVESEDAATRAPRGPTNRPAVIWLGLDGLDWELLDRLAAEGKMPNWRRLTDEGYSAELESFAPLLSPILWTSAATGVTPDVHRVLDFQEVDPRTGRKVPISGASRVTPAVWNVVSTAGRRVGVVGWWATHPAEEVNGFFVSDHASPILFEGLSIAGGAFPPHLEAGVAQVASRDGRVSAADLSPYLAESQDEIAAALAGGGMKDPVVALSRILAATRVTQRIGRDLYDRNPTDLLAIYFEGTDEVGHVFALDTPPRLDCPSVSDADVAKYGSVVETYFATIDRILGQWMRRAREDRATLIVHSDHGFKWGSDRPCGLASGAWSTAAFWHRFEGVLAAWGADVRHSATRRKASLLDVAPTVLALLGVPADRAMIGKTIPDLVADARSQPRGDVFAGITVRRVAAAPVPEKQSDEYAKKLLALGYLSPGDVSSVRPPGGDRPALTEGAWNNLGVYERETRRDLAAASAAFQQSLKIRPDYYSPMFNLAVLERTKGNTRAAEDWLFRSLAAVKGDPSTAVAGWAREYVRDGKIAAARSLLDRAARTYSGSEIIARERARLLYRYKDCGGALAALSPFEAATSDAQTLNDLALFETCRGDRDAVRRLLERSLAVRPDQPEVARLLERVRRAD